jgi:hypothetical protein
MTTTFEFLPETPSYAKEAVNKLLASLQEPAEHTAPVATGDYTAFRAPNLPTSDRYLTTPYAQSTDLDANYNQGWDKIFLETRSFKEMHKNLKDKAAKGI